MAERVPALIAAVLTEADFDVAEPTALRWLDAQHRLMVKRSKCFRRRLSPTPAVTEAARSAYSVPEEVIELIEVLVGGVPYGQGRHSDIAVSAQGWLLISGMGGVVVEDESSAGGYELALVPAPIEGGATIELYAVCRAGALLATDDMTLKVPPEYDEALIAGAISIGLARDEGRPELAASYRAEFEGGCTELRQEVARRNAPRRARVAGYNA